MNWKALVNWKSLVTSLSATFLSLAAVMAHADTSVPPQTYRYGTPLDIAHVSSITHDAGPACGLTTFHMTYQDSQNQQHVLDYLDETPDCTNQN